MSNLLTISNLQKKYYDLKGEIEAIANLNFSVKDKEFLSIIGPSGCGKSTILSILSGLETKTSGHVKYNKDNPKIGYMLQTDSLFPWLTVLENCLLGLKINNKITDTKKEKVTNLLYKYGLKEFVNSYPNSLSGGMRQRVALIRTLAIDPDILLLDEPFSALDYQTRLALSDDIYKIIRAEKKTVIMVTHDIAEAISLSDRVLVMTKRPGSIKKIYDIELTNKKSPIENRKCKEFTKYYDELWRELDVHL